MIERRPRPPADETRTARSAALAALGRRELTTKELRARLVTQGYSLDDINQTLERLTDAGIVDDRRVAFAFVRTSVVVRGRGPSRIARELEARGVASDIIKAALAQYPAEDQDAQLRRVLEKTRGSKPLDKAGRDRLFRQLMRRGFSAGAIAKALKIDVEDA